MNTEEYNDLVNDLIKGTNFDICSDSVVLTERKKVRTPLEAINCLLGGGFPFGSIIHAYGKSRSGKSTIFYQGMAEFQKQYPEGIAVILDTEASSDGTRLRYFGIDTNKILRLPAPSIESGFISLNKMLDNKENNKKLKDKPVYAIWDSISGKAQDESSNSRMNAQDRARIIKNYLGPTMSRLERNDFILCLINQVVNSTDRYGNSHETFGGGQALLHYSHISLHLSHKGNDYDAGFSIRSNSSLDVEKSKVSPEVQGIAMIMDSTKGGRIDEIRSFTDYLYNIGYIIHKSNTSKYNLSGFSNDKVFTDNPVFEVLNDFNKDYRNYDSLVKEVRNNDVLYDSMRFLLMSKLVSMYELQSKVIIPYMNEVRLKIISELSKDSEVAKKLSDQGDDKEPDEETSKQDSSSTDNSLDDKEKSE